MAVSEPLISTEPVGAAVQRKAVLGGAHIRIPPRRLTVAAWSREESRFFGTQARGSNPGSDRADAHDSRPAADKDELCVPNPGIAATSAGSADPLGRHRLMVGCGRRAAGHAGV
jgi:hypothetical protein